MSVSHHDTAERLKKAEERLAVAIGRLEAALEAQADNAPGQGVPDPALAEEISRLQSENAELRDLVGEAATRLDGAIGQLKSRMPA